MIDRGQVTDQASSGCAQTAGELKGAPIPQPPDSRNLQAEKKMQQESMRHLQYLEPVSFSENVRRWAIIVGISRYKNESLNLKYADRDAEELYKLLQTPAGGGFEADHIKKLINEEATTANVTRALRSFLKLPAKEDIVLIYLACHGTPDPNRPANLYLLTHDTDPNDIAGTAIRMREVSESLQENLLAQRVVIIADTCHSAAISGGVRGSIDSAAIVNRYLQSLSDTQEGIAWLTSAEASEVSQEDEKWGGGHGVFTYYLLEGMRGAADSQPRDSIVTVGELFEYVREHVKEATNDQQHPFIGGKYDRHLPMAVVLANKQWQDYVCEDRSYFVYTPANYHVGAAVPLVMLLHGAFQSPSDLAYDTQMNQLADQQQFLVVYPQLYPQSVDPKPENPFTFFLEVLDECNQHRGSGEADRLAGIVQTIIQNTSRWTIDRRRIYVAGLSIGAAWAVILGVTYPDLFAAIGVHSGVEFQWASLPSPVLLGQVSVAGGLEPSGDERLLRRFHLLGSQFGPGPDPIEQGQKAYEAMGSFARMVPTIVFHGTADPIVVPINGEQVVRQWLHTNHLASHGTFTANFESPSSIGPGQVPGGRSYMVFTWKDASGNDVVAYWLVDGMGHAWSGGRPDRFFTDPQGPSATRAMYEFFMAHTRE